MKKTIKTLLIITLLLATAATAHSIYNDESINVITPADQECRETCKAQPTTGAPTGFIEDHNTIMINGKCQCRTITKQT